MKFKKFAGVGLLFAVVLSASGISCAFAANMMSKYFTDVNPNSYGWAAEYVDYIAENNIANGVGNGLYAPEVNIKKGDFAVLTDRTFKLEKNDNVIGNAYYSQAVANCGKANIIANVNIYEPLQDITRIEAVSMIYNALRNGGYYTQKIDIDKINVFSDNNLIVGVNEKNAAVALYDLGIISGDNEHRLNPDSTMTRAEMAVIFAKLNRYIADNAAAAAQSANEPQENTVPAESAAEQAKPEETENKIVENQKLRDLKFELNDDITSIDIKFMPDTVNDYTNMSEKMNIYLYDRFDKLIYEKKDENVSIQNNHDVVEYSFDLQDINKFLDNNNASTTLTHSRLVVEVTSDGKICATGEYKAEVVLSIPKYYESGSVRVNVNVEDMYINSKSKLHIKIKCVPMGGKMTEQEESKVGGISCVCTDLMGKTVDRFKLSSNTSADYELSGATSIIRFE